MRIISIGNNYSVTKQKQNQQSFGNALEAKALDRKNFVLGSISSTNQALGRCFNRDAAEAFIALKDNLMLIFGSKFGTPEFDKGTQLFDEMLVIAQRQEA